MKVEIKSMKDLPMLPKTTATTVGVYNTGAWRSAKPVMHEDKCNKCYICWKYCPEPCIKIKDEKGGEIAPKIDYFYCKGCGICANECPKKAIEMVMEA